MCPRAFCDPQTYKGSQRLFLIITSTFDNAIHASIHQCPTCPVQAGNGD